MIEQAILMVCLNFKTADTYQSWVACTQALRAASIQTQVKPRMDALEQQIQKRVIEETSDLPFKYGGPVYAAAVKNEFFLTFKVSQIRAEVSVSTDNNGQNLRFVWTI